MSEIVTFAPTTAGDGDEFVIPFPYLEQSHVKLYVNGVEDTAKQFVSDGAVKASVAITAGDIVVVKRETPRSALITTLGTSGTLSSDDINHQSLQAVYVATEAADGLREGLSLDEATETYWEAAPYGINRVIKDVVDPSAATEAATKGWYDQQLINHAANAATSASNAATSATAAASSAATATSGASVATTQAAAATASATAAAASAATATTAGTNATDAGDEAEAWANTAEDTTVNYPNNGGINDNPSYSALHWAAKADADATAVAADKAFAQTVAANSYPFMSSRILGDEAGVCINHASWTVTSIDPIDNNTNFYNKDARAFIEDHLLDLVQGGDLTVWTNRNWQEVGAGDMQPPSNWRTGTMGPGTHSGGGLSYHGGWATAPGNGLFGGAGTVSCVDAQALSYGPGTPLVNSRNPSRITASTGSPSSAYIWQNVGLNGSRQIDQGYKFTATIVVPHSSHQPASNAWDDILVEVYNDVDNLTYRAQIELDNNVVTAGHTFSGYRQSTSFDGNWVRYDFFCPGSIAGEITYNVGTFRVYFCDSSGDETGLTFAGTENYYIAYMHLHRGWFESPLTDSTGGGSTFSTQFPIDGSGNPITDYITNTEPPVTFFGSTWFWGEDVHENNTSSPTIMTGCDGSGSVLYVRHDPDGSVTGTSDRLYVTCTDGNTNTSTHDLGVNLGVTDTDNVGYGTKWDYCLRADKTGFQFSYRINDGTIVHQDRVSWVGLDFGGTWDPNRTYLGPSSGNQFAGRIDHYCGYQRRYVDEDEAERLMTVPPLAYT